MINRILFLVFLLLHFSMPAQTQLTQLACNNTTTGVSAITNNSAVSGGNVCSSSVGSITSRGLCWSTSTSPVPGQSGTFTVQSGSGTGSFTAIMTGLARGTRYYVRSYAVPTKGYVYGNEVTFVTQGMVTTSSLFDIRSNSAKCGGNVLADGGSQIVARGVCWSTSANPTIALTTKTNDGATQGAFTSNITGLQPNTFYYVRAYVSTSAGITQYGAQISFQTYMYTAMESVTIGSQIWALKDLDVARYRNGDPITQGADLNTWSNATTGAWRWWLNDSARYAATYGRFYNWYAVNDARGLCPAGWHVPSVNEWYTLATYLGGLDVAGGKMKSTSSWDSPNTDATNSSGFSGLPTKRITCEGKFVISEEKREVAFWCSDEQSCLNEYAVCSATYCGLAYGLVYNSGKLIYIDKAHKLNGYKVRCLKD